MADRLLQPLRQLASRGATAALTDRDLLSRFVDLGDQDAFAELVRRHSGVVWRACRSVLPPADAEDAFQAAFVVLARKARRVRGNAVAGWLFRVAYRISLRAWRRLQRERPAAYDHEPPARPDDGLLGWRELQAVLQAEMPRMPAKYREAFLCCVVEGQTKAEAARRLAVPVGTVSSRLAKAREMLRVRLTRRGIELPAVLAALSVGSAVSAKVVRQAIGGATGQQRIAASVSNHLRPAGDGPVSQKILLVGLTAVAVGVGLGLRADPPAGTDPPKAADPDRPVVETRTDADGDPLPPGALFRFGTARFRRAEAFRATVLSADGTRMAAAGAAAVTIWDLKTGRVVREFPPTVCDTAQGGQLAFLDGDRRLATSTKMQSGWLTINPPEPVQGQVARVWDLNSGKRLGNLMVKEDTDWAGAGGVWPVDGGRKLLTVSSLLVGAGQGPARKTVAIVWDAVSLKELERQVHAIPITEVLDYSAAGDRVVCRRHSDPTNENRGEGDTLCVFDRKTGKEVWSRAAKEELHSLHVAVGPDGSSLAICRDKKLELVDLATGKVRELKVNPSYWGSKPVFSADGKSLLFANHNTLFRFEAPFDAAPQKMAAVSRGFKFHLLPDGKAVVGVDGNDIIQQYDLATGQAAPREPNYVFSTKAACQRRGDLVAVSDAYGKLDLWNARDGKVVRSLRPARPSYGQPAYSLQFSPDDQILASATTAGVIDLWSIADGKLLHSVPVGKDAKDKVDGADFIQFSADGKRLYFLPRNRPTACIDVATGRRVEIDLATWSDFGLIVPESTLALFPGGRLVDLATGKEVRKVAESIRTHWELHAGSMSADGKRYAGTKVGPDGHLICVWDLQTGQELMSAGGFQVSMVPVVRLHPDGKWVTVQLQDGTLRTWEVATGEQVHKVEGLNYHVWQTMVLGPHGRSALPCNDMSPLLYSLRPPDTPKAFGPELWDRLAGGGAAAYRAQWAMLDHPDQALDLLEQKLPVEATKRERAWFDDRAAKLDDAQFRTREAAARDLGEAVAEIPLEWTDAAIKGSKSPEARERLEKLKRDREAALAPNHLRIERAVQVVELIDTPRARKLLENWSKGQRLSNLKESAAAGLNRLR
jgi:RNA polymerase sigma factor (sigma-70 family)